MTKVTDLIQKIRTDLKLTQAKLASEAGMDQSRLSRIEKGDVNSETDILDLLKALKNLGSLEAEKYLAFSKFEWTSLQPVSFSNPHRETLSHIDGVLRSVNSFLDNPNYPWPLKKQVENYKSRIMDSAGYLARTEHNIAVIGDIGTGKSTAISYLFDLLKTSPKGNSITDNPILETGAGGTTICEVHIKSGPEFGLTINPMPQADLEALVSDFSSAKWNAINNKSTNGKTESVGVSREVDRAIRNMSKLVRKKTKVDGKFSYEDPTHQLVNESTSEEDFRTKVLALMNLHERDKNELWYDSSTRQNPMEWIADTFKKINNGRISECPLPSRINLLIPNFNSLANDLSLTVIDTKGVDDLAVREDLDNRLKDPRTAVVFCCRFNDAPGTSAKALLHHMRETISDKIDEGKVLVLALPRDGEAIAMKDDLGDLAETPEEGYEFKKMQLESEFAADDMENIAVEFLNVGSDDSFDVRTRIVAQVALLRDSVSKKALESCDAALDIISNHEDHALNFAVEAVSKKLEHFIQGTPNLSTRENHAHKQLLDSVESTRYASTLWAATRRNGIYSGLNSLHLIGIGASKDTKKRSGLWLSNLDSFLSALECDEDLKIASKTITSIRNKALECQQEFVERSRSIAIETYKEPLSHSHVWYDCANEWGQGPGFKTRVVKHLSEWFNMQNELQENLEKSIQSSFSELVKKPLLALSAHS